MINTYKFAVFVSPLKGVTTVTMIVSPALRGAMVTEKHETSMIALRGATKKIEESVIIKQEISRIAVL